MKIRLAMIAFILSSIVTNHTFAQCATITRTSCESGYCVEAEAPCACTDPGWRWNDCISRGVYCAAFGNVGGLDEAGG